MSRSLRIAVADDEPVMCEYLEKTLPLLGHKVVAVATSGRELIDLCAKSEPELIITDIKMPDMDGIEAAGIVVQNRPVPVILVSAYHDPKLIERAGAEYVQAFLVKPIKQADLETSIGVALQRYEQFRALYREAQDLRQALADRKVIERAKGIVMNRTGQPEQAVFQRMQKLASSRNMKMVDLAQMVLTVEELFAPAQKT
ncbi:MAG TPA: response regulator [Gemmataceae bacterium]|nr:response regulator [Gemmataceae bacterium]